MFCPQCRSEYRAEFTRCESCGVSLVPALPPEPGDPSDRDLVTAFETGDPGLLALAHSILDDTGIAYLTQGEGIQDLFGVGRLGTGFNILTGPVHIQVERERETEVRALLAGLEENAARSEDLDERDREPEV